MQQRGKLCTLGAGVPLNMEFGIDLIHILLDASLGEVALLCDLAVAQALRHQLHDLKFPRRQCAEGRRTETLCASRQRRFAERGDPRGKSRSRFPCQQGLQDCLLYTSPSPRDTR